MPARTQYVEVEGMDDMRRAMNSLAPSTNAAVMDQFAWELDIMFELSQVYVPKDTRALMQSGQKIGPEVTPGGVEAGIAYGGINLNPKTGEPTNTYAVEVHENLDQRHMPPTRSKYVEVAILERMPALEQRIARFVGPEVELALRMASRGAATPTRWRP